MKNLQENSVCSVSKTAIPNITNILDCAGFRIQPMLKYWNTTWVSLSLSKVITIASTFMYRFAVQFARFVITSRFLIETSRRNLRLRKQSLKKYFMWRSDYIQTRERSRVYTLAEEPLRY